MGLKMIEAPPLESVARGVAGLWSIEAQGFSPDGNSLLVKAVYSDTAYPAVPTRTAFWTYDLQRGQYGVSVNALIASDRAIEVSDVSISEFGAQAQLIATYRETQATTGLDFNKLALIRHGVLVQADLLAQISGNLADAMIDAVKVSANGRFVAVQTAATNLTTELDTNACKDIYLLDLLLDTSRRVTSINGVEPGFDCLLGDVLVGADGAVSVAFQSAQAFTAQDTNTTDDVFVWRLAQADFASASAGSITLVSRSAAGAAGGINPQLNLMGALFSSESGAFSDSDQNNVNDVWQSGATAPTLISASPTGTLSGPSSLASTSDGGRYVALVTASPEIAGNTGVEQLVVIDTLTHSVSVISQAANGVLADDAVISPVLSANGTQVAFSSQASNLGAGPFDGLMHLYVADLQNAADRTEGGKSLDLIIYSWKTHSLLAGVSVSAGIYSGTSDAAGALSLTDLTEPSLSLAVNLPIPAAPSAQASATAAAVNLQDAIAILKMIVGLPVNPGSQALSPYQALAADFNSDGKVGLTDAIGVLKHVVGLDAPAPTWHFVRDNDASLADKASTEPGKPQTSVTLDMSEVSSVVQLGLVGYLSGDVDGSTL